MWVQVVLIRVVEGELLPGLSNLRLLNPILIPNNLRFLLLKLWVDVLIHQQMRNLLLLSLRVQLQVVNSPHSIENLRGDLVLNRHAIEFSLYHAVPPATVIE